MKKTLLSALLLCGAHFSNAQVEFNHSTGLTYLLVHSVTRESNSLFDYEGTTIAGYPGVTYNPRIDFVLDRNSSISITSYPTLALNLSVGSGGSSGYLALEAPIMGQYNFGNHSTQTTRKDFGGFVACGYNIGFYSANGLLHGPTAQAGVKFYFRDRPMGVRLEYSKPIGLSRGDKANIFGIGLLYNIER